MHGLHRALSSLFVKQGTIRVLQHKTWCTFTIFKKWPASMLLLPCLPSVMMMFPFRVSHTVLLWFRVMVMLRLFSRASVFLAFPSPSPLLLFAFNLPCRLAAVADALSGMDNSNFLLLLLLLLLLPDSSHL
jgi:hypothetical protein